jgi:hypothetical protein
LSVAVSMRGDRTLAEELTSNGGALGDGDELPIAALPANPSSGSANSWR